jgi:DNA transposition AAA+ family ATPase
MSGLQDHIQYEHPNISPEQLEKVKEVDEYLSTNRVHEILNVIESSSRKPWPS